MPKHSSTPKKSSSVGCLLRLIISGLIVGAAYWLLFSPSNSAETTTTQIRTAGTWTPAQQAALEQLQQTATTPIDLQSQDGVVRILNGHLFTGTAGASASTIAHQFLQANQALLQIEAPEKNLVLLGQTTDANGHAYIAYEQRFQGVPVLGSEVRLKVSTQNDVAAMSAGYAPALQLEVKPSIRSVTAEQTVLQTLGAAKLLTSTALAIYDPRVFGEAATEARLVWVVQTESSTPSDVRTYLVDAQTGAILTWSSQLLGVFRREIFDAQGGDFMYALIFGTQLADVNGPRPGVTLKGDALAAWDASQRVYDYYFNTFGRDSYDGHNGLLKIYVNVSNVEGAWHTFFDRMFLHSGWVSPDIVAHEFTHGVIISSQWPRRFLWQSGEARSLNESYADAFAAFIDNTDPWKITWPAAPGGVGRDIPNAKPDKYADRMTDCSGKDTNGQDKGAVCAYTNMSIPNLAVYLLTEGGTRNGITVQRLGRNKVQHIYYHVIQYKLIFGANFEQARQATLESCRELINQYEITASDCDQVQNAFAAVGIGQVARTPEQDNGNFLAVLLENFRQAIRSAIDDAIGNLRQRIQQWLDDTVRQIQVEIQKGMDEAIKKIMEELERTFIKFLDQTLQSLCGTSASLLTLPLILGVWFKVRRRK